MKTVIALTMLIGLVGCASTPPTASNPIAPITIDCSYATAMSAELEYIIATPNASSSKWQNTFAGLSGYQTAQQRTSSAKSILWTIRTKCPGF